MGRSRDWQTAEPRVEADMVTEEILGVQVISNCASEYTQTLTASLCKHRE